MYKLFIYIWWVEVTCIDKILGENKEMGVKGFGISFSNSYI